MDDCKGTYHVRSKLKFSVFLHSLYAGTMRIVLTNSSRFLGTHRKAAPSPKKEPNIEASIFRMGFLGVYYTIFSNKEHRT